MSVREQKELREQKEQVENDNLSTAQRKIKYNEVVVMDKEKLHEDIGYLKASTEHNARELTNLSKFVRDHMNKEEEIVKGIKKQMLLIFSLLLIILAKDIPLQSLLSLLALL